MSEESRLGREAIETADALKQLVQAGVRVFFYMENRERTLDSPTDNIMMSLTAFADELEREKARQRTYDAMQRKAKARHVTGGSVFGYRNLDVPGPDGRRSYVERQIDPAHAAVVREIFELCAQGLGRVTIAKHLNERAASADAMVIETLLEEMLTPERLSDLTQRLLTRAKAAQCAPETDRDCSPAHRGRNRARTAHDGRCGRR